MSLRTILRMTEERRRKKEEACDIDEEQSGTGGRTMQESDEEIFEQL